jgi:hypothetical protein
MPHLAVEAVLGICSGASLALFLAWSVIGVAVLVEWVCRRLFKRTHLDYQHYAAEQAIRDIKRRAIQELLAAERHYHKSGSDGDVIEGTAVEVRQ